MEPLKKAQHENDRPFSELKKGSVPPAVLFFFVIDSLQ